MVHPPEKRLEATHQTAGRAMAPNQHLPHHHGDTDAEARLYKQQDRRESQYADRRDEIQVRTLSTRHAHQHIGHVKRIALVLADEQRTGRK